MAPYSVLEGDDSGPSRSLSPATSTSSSNYFEEPFSPRYVVPPITLPDSLPFDRSLPKLLAKIAGTEDFNSVTSIKLKVITQEVCLERLCVYMPALVELDLTGSHMVSLRDLGCGLNNLLILRVGRCQLISLDGLFGMTSVEELYAPDNSIDCVGYCAALPNLRILDLQKNNISSLRQIEYLSMCPTLKELVLKDCEAATMPNYREAVGAMCPKLRMLDGVLLVNTELSGNEERVIKSSQVRKGVQRPKTSVDRRGASEWGPKTGRIRPATAQPTRNKTLDLEDGSIFNDTPSKLTSGVIMCGNLAAALRGQRKKRSAWANVSPDEKEQVDKLNTKNNTSEESQLQNNLTPVENIMPEPELIQVSRKWREAYKTFRVQLKNKWEQEDIEDL
uniref:Leucine-rich repeat-containing protein 56 n=1 Tax=Clastoptera arizonana TaxID=38151 RepID=A0A1B6DRR1_9HEMI